MKNAMMLASAALAVGVLLSGSAFASDRPMVVAEEGVSIHLGGGDHDRDARHHHHPSIVVGGHRDHRGGDHDHDR